MAAAKPAPGPAITLEELYELLATAARKGNVPAMRILLEELKAGGEGEHQGAAPSILDELAKRRAASL